MEDSLGSPATVMHRLQLL